MTHVGFAPRFNKRKMTKIGLGPDTPGASLIFIKDPFKKGLQPVGGLATEAGRLKLT
jgi:hypothetical protein